MLLPRVVVYLSTLSLDRVDGDVVKYFEIAFKLVLLNKIIYGEFKIVEVNHEVPTSGHYVAS